jgi:DNA-binding NtrC family response regulator
MGDKIKILLVEDEEQVRKALASFLISKGYLVDDVEDGELAMGKLSSSDYNILITDLKMPVMDGTDLVKTVRNIKPNIGIIVLTGFGDIDSYIDLTNVGAFEYINKTLSIEDLYEDICVTIEKLISTMEEKEP